VKNRVEEKKKTLKKPIIQGKKKKNLKNIYSRAARRQGHKRKKRRKNRGEAIRLLTKNKTS